MFNNNIHKHFYYHIQSLSRTRSCLTSLQVVHNPLLVCVHFVAFFFLQTQFPWLLPRGNQIFVWFGLNICVNNLNNRSSLISTTVEENLTCSAEAAWQTSSNVSVDVATENEEMGGERFFRSRVSREKKKMEKKIKAAEEEEKPTKVGIGLKQVSRRRRSKSRPISNGRRSSETRFKTKTGRARGGQGKWGKGGIFPPTPPNGSFPNGCGRAWLTTSHCRRRHRCRRRRCRRRRRSLLTCFSGNFARDEKQLHRRQTS